MEFSPAPAVPLGGLAVAAEDGYAMYIPIGANSLFGGDIVNDIDFLNPLVYDGLNDPCALAMAQAGAHFTSWFLTAARIRSKPSPFLAGFRSGRRNSPVLPRWVGQYVHANRGAKLWNRRSVGSEPWTANTFDLVSGTLGDPVTLDGFPIGIITNKAADTFEVFFASLPQVVPVGVDSITTTGTKTILHVTSTDLPLGRGVSPDGTKLYVGVRGGGINIQDNQ